MRRLARFGAVAGLVGSLGLSASVFGQEGVSVPAPLPLPGNLDQLAAQMADEVGRLGADVASGLGNAPRGRDLAENTRELGQALAEFRNTLANRADRFQVRQSYAGIDASWHHLAGELSRQNPASPAVDRDAQRVAQTDARIHQALGLNDYPPGYYGSDKPLTGMADLQRLSHALADRAEALAAVVRADLVGPGTARIVQDAVNLAQTADTFHDALKLNGQVDATIQNGFSGVTGLSDRLQADFAQAPPSPRVRDAMRRYLSAEVLVRQALGLPSAPEDVSGTVLAPVPQGGTAPVTALADQLVQQSTDFVNVFGSTGGRVPEAGLFLADAQALQQAATAFRADAARGLDPSALAYEFRDVDAVWQRLARRTNRIAQGRTGPNIQQVGRMGQTVAEIHRLLGIPGYPPTLVAP